VFENNELRRVFGSKRQEVTGDWTKVPDEQLYNLHSSPDIIRVNKSRIMRWSGYVARNTKGKDHFRNLNVLVG
jgi:hypothetical protein